ncbi:MAG: DUF3536 domain-containing protein [Bacteroidota bacterium]
MSSASKYVCIHGHFYQPPRENAWLETIESQPSAAPFHDWNERINYECYAPNAAARVLNEEQFITAVSNNYERISFNFGPTLLSWLAEKDPVTYQLILDADRDSRQRFDGHGSAVAQVYNHLIMPLANERDIQTQVKWGVADFVARFGRQPEGMWLAETAVDTATLEALVDNDITYTILAPRQAKAVRFGDQGNWYGVDENSIDTRRAYRCNLPSGRSISIFFYDGRVSRAVAFEGLLNDGKLLAGKLMGALNFQSDEVQLSHIATDGESYGHHHKKGEMALAACLNHIDENPHVQLTNYGQFLELHPPVWECQVHDNSSWSCVHGVERWRSNCGCHTGGQAGWNQSWRDPLRKALDFVREQAIKVFEEESRGLLLDPWAARDAYIQVILNRSTAQKKAFLDEHAQFDDYDQLAAVRMLRLLEMQRHAMLMYTSCGWFFNEVSGIETLQILQYALRVLHLVEVLTGNNYQATFEELLEQTPSNVHENAAISYRENVQPAKVGLMRVAMHYAASSLFEDEPEKLDVFTYRVESQDFVRTRAGAQRLALGRTIIHNRLTNSQSSFSFISLYLGQQSVIGAVTSDPLTEPFEQIHQELKSRFRKGDLSYFMHGMRQYFGDKTFSLWHLFRDEKRKILLMISEKNLELAAKNFADVYYDNYQLMSSMKENHLVLPAPYLAAVSFTLRQRTMRALQEEELNLRRLRRIVTDFRHWEHQWSATTAAELQKVAEERVFRELTRGLQKPTRLPLSLELLRFLQQLDLQPNYWQSQNIFISALQRQRDRLLLGMDEAELSQLGRELNIAMPAVLSVS